MASRTTVGILVAVVVAGMFGRVVARAQDMIYDNGVWSTRPSEVEEIPYFDIVLITLVALVITATVTENIRTLLSTAVNYAWTIVIILLLLPTDASKISGKALPVCPA